MGQQDQGVLRLGDVKQDFTGRGKVRTQDRAVVVHHVIPQWQEQEEGEKEKGPEFPLRDARPAAVVSFRRLMSQ